MEIVSSKNIFVNSELNVTGDGESFKLDFPNQDFSAKYPAMIRLTLLQAVIRRVWYQVNETNNMLFFTNRTLGGWRLYPFEIPIGDYYTFEELCSSIDDAWNNIWAPNFYQPGWTQAGVTLPYPAVASFSPLPGVGRMGPLTTTYNNITRKLTFAWLSSNTAAPPGNGLPIGIRGFEFVSPQARNLANLNTAIPPTLFVPPLVPTDMPQMMRDVMGSPGQFTNSWEILGGRVTRPINPQLMFEPPPLGTYPAGVGVTITAFYPAQLNTLEAIYLRTNLIGNNFTTLGFEKDPTSGNNVELIPSTCLAKIPLHSPVATIRTCQLLTNPRPGPLPTDVPTYRTTDANMIVMEDYNGAQNLQIGGQNLTFAEIAMTDAEGRVLTPVDPLQPFTF